MVVIHNSKYEKFPDKIHHNHHHLLWSLDFKNCYKLNVGRHYVFQFKLILQELVIGFIPFLRLGLIWSNLFCVIGSIFTLENVVVQYIGQAVLTFMGWDHKSNGLLMVIETKLQNFSKLPVTSTSYKISKIKYCFIPLLCLFLWV